MSDVQKIILEALKTGKKLPAEHLFSSRELAFLVKERLVSSLVPPDTQSYSAAELFSSQQQHRKAIITTLKELNDQAGVSARYAVIKGLSFERCIYGDNLRRDMSDIDILIHPSDAEALHKTLLSMGYRQQTGPSSIGSADTPSRVLAAIRASQNTKDLTFAEPVRRHPFKGELSPYVRPDSPTIEIHDSFRGLPSKYLDHLIEDANTLDLHLITEPLDKRAWTNGATMILPQSSESILRHSPCSYVPAQKQTGVTERRPERDWTRYCA